MKGSIILFVASCFISMIHSSSLFALSDESSNAENPLDNFLDFTPSIEQHIVDDDGSIVVESPPPLESDPILWQNDPNPELDLPPPLQSPDVYATNTIAFYSKYKYIYFFPAKEKRV